VFGDSTIDIILNTSIQNDARNQISKIIRQYDRANKRILHFRNFVVHGPKGRIDEFADLRSWELAGIFLHNDLWLDYNNAFEGARSEWATISRNLIISMEAAAAAVQLLNEALICAGAFQFTSKG
jgi:hypothetical protein